MGRLLDKIREAVGEDRLLVSWHADEQCDERSVLVWELVAGLDDAELVRERPGSKPNPSVLVRQRLPDGQEVQVVLAWLSRSRRAKLVTCFFEDG